MGKKWFATLFATLILETVFVDINNESCYPILDMAVEIIWYYLMKFLFWVWIDIKSHTFIQFATVNATIYNIKTQIFENLVCLGNILFLAKTLPNT